MRAFSLVLCALGFVALHASGTELRPWPENPWYWEFRGKPVLLLGGSDDDNLFQWPEKELVAQLERLAAAGGNLIRNTMSDRKDKGFEVHAFGPLENGKYDLNEWNPEYWERFDRMLRETAKRGIVVQIEVWDRFDFTDSGGANRWQIHPFNPKNNVNYSYQDSGFAESYPDHPGANRQPFFFTTPEQHNNTTVLKYQHRFVEKMLSLTLQHGHVLYCMDNETSGEEAWSRYWAQFVRDHATKQGKTVYLTEMWDNWNLADDIHRRTFDHPEYYDFVDISQNNHIRGEEHWNNFLFVRGYLAGSPRPMNAIKTYGANKNKFGDTDKDGVERVLRHCLAGGAAARFHRPDSGLGLNDTAVAVIRAVRKLESKIPAWTLSPANDLLSEREPNEAFLAANPGKAYALYFPQGGTIKLELPDADAPWLAHWIDVISGEWGPQQPFSGSATAIITAPGPGHWAAAIIPSK